MPGRRELSLTPVPLPEVQDLRERYRAEMRAQIVSFGFLGQQFRLGAQAFADAGRIWSDFKIDKERDGTGIGLKYGVGGGVHFIWGEAAIIRLEVAYSPDATSANPGLPLGLYAADGLAF